METYLIAAIFYPFAPNAYIISYKFHRVISPGREGLKQFLRRVIQYTEWPRYYDNFSLKLRVVRQECALMQRTGFSDKVCPWS